MAKALATIISDLRRRISSRRPALSLEEGSLPDDVLIQPSAAEFKIIYDEAETVNLNQSILTANSDGLDIAAENIGILRKLEIAAAGYCTFFKRTSPTIDIIIPLGTAVTTEVQGDNSGVQFITTQALTMYASLAASYLNPSTNVYELVVPIVAVLPGVTGVVGADAILRIVSTISGIDGCYNAVGTSGGTSKESDTALQGRIAEKQQGLTVGTYGGYINEVLAFSNVEDAKVIGRGETSRLDVGAIDIYIKGKISRGALDVLPDNAAILPNGWKFLHQPLDAAVAVSASSAASGSLTLPAGSVVIDTGSYAGSIRAEDKLADLSTFPFSSYGNLIMSYAYNGLIEDIQAYFDTSSRAIVNADVLVKSAVDIPIDLEVTIKVLAGFDPLIVQAEVYTNLSIFFSQFAIQAEVQQADIAREILNTPGIDDVYLPFATLQSSDGTILRNSNNNLTIPAYAYASEGEFLITY